MASHQGPGLCLKIDGEGGKYAWELELHANDAAKQRWLGYKSAGNDLKMAVITPDFDLKVNDAKPDGPWTTMPVEHRKDIRQALQSILSDALDALGAVKLKAD